MKHFGLIGRRLGHSYSQRWFEELFARLGLNDCSYQLFELSSVDHLREWAFSSNILGFNVTIPYKQAIIPHLDALDPMATDIGAVNCVTVEQSRLIGYNTDALAFKQTLGTKHFQQALILGTGGAARAVAYALDRLDTPYTFVSRHPELHLDSIGYTQLATLHLPPSTLIVNATPVGMFPDVDKSPFDPATLHTPHSTFHFYDLVYNPSPTLFLRQAAALGASTQDGLEMLHRQAELSWQHFLCSFQ